MKLILLMAMAALLCGRGALAQGPDATSLSQLQGAEREQRLVAGARREGEVSVFTSLVSEDMAALAAAFESRYGVKGKHWRAGSGKILQRAVTEARSNRFEVDVIETNRPELEAMHPEKGLARALSAHDAPPLPASLQPHRRRVGSSGE